jgi:purine-binding chemotaxis protein CheW
MANIIANEVLEEEDTQKDNFLTFTLDSEVYGIEIKYVMEIIGMQSISKVPDLPEYVKGIINLRGKIIPVMDVRIKFNKEPKEYNDRTSTIIVEMNDIFVGLIIDSVSEVIIIPESEIVAPPEFSVNKNKYICGIGKTGEGVILLVNCNKLLNEEETNALDNAGDKLL